MQGHCKQYKSGNYDCWPYRWLVRWPGEEDPLVTLRVFGVQAVEDVAGFLRCEQRKQERIVILVPALLWFSVPVQHQLLCREKRTVAQLWPAFWTRPSFSFLYRSWWRSSLSWRRLPSPELGSLWVEVLLRQPDIKQKSQNWGWGSGEDARQSWLYEPETTLQGDNLIHWQTVTPSPTILHKGRLWGLAG